MNKTNKLSDDKISKGQLSLRLYNYALDVCTSL